MTESLVLRRQADRRDQIDVLEHLFREVVEQLVQMVKLRTLHVPVRLLGLTIEVERVGEVLIQKSS